MSTTASPSLAAIEARGLRKTFGDVVAVDDVTLHIEPGEIVALLGPNGAGKTTTIDLLLGLQEPDRGERHIFGMSPRQAIARGLVGAVQQAGALPGDMTVSQVLRFIAGTMRDHRPIPEVMDAAGITAIAKRSVSKCSGGEKQRVRLAIALLPDPLFLFLDEPTVGMDVAARTAFWTIMTEEAERGRTVLFATHYLNEAQQFAERTIIVNSGCIVADGSTEELAERYAASCLRLTYTCSDSEALAALNAATASHDWQIDAEHGHLTVKGHDLDDAARIGLALPGAHGLTLAHSTIEDAYIALTEENAA